ncbi:MAG TPA: GNAT family N-acetyltransferase [Ferruginibacter sp.]|nr:GNAT family N-acetyltransferase [Ferruginibacter sp.]
MLEPNFSPFPELETTRLLLRCVEITDAAKVFELRSMDKTMQYIDREKLVSIDEAEVLIKKILETLENKEGINWCIAFKEEPQNLIGTIGFWRLIKQHFRAEVGYMLHPNYWKKGIMKEAIKAIIEYGFNKMNIHSIEAHINPENIASSTLLESTGFIREAYFKEDFYCKGEFQDTAIYSLLNKK